MTVGLIGYPELRAFEDSGIVAEVSDARSGDNSDVEKARAMLREWWASHGVDHQGIEKWATEQSAEDCTIAQKMWGRLLTGDVMFAMIATSYELGILAGFRLAVEGTVKA
jgi:cell division FtsZ-interacting protein ZapD